MQLYPEDLRYSPEHTWARVEGGQVVVGITHYAQEQLGDVVYVELPEAGQEFAQHQVFGVVESVKSVNDLYSPVSGTVLRRNDALLDQPEIINRDPYGEGWMIVLEMKDRAELEKLLSAEDYRRQVEEG